MHSRTYLLWHYPCRAPVFWFLCSRSCCGSHLHCAAYRTVPHVTAVRAHTRRLKKHGVPCAELHEMHERSAASRVVFSSKNSPTHYVRNVAARSAIIEIAKMLNFEVMDEHFKLYSICIATTTFLSFMHSGCQAAWLGVLLHSGCHAAWLGVLWLHSGCQIAWMDCCYILGVMLRGWVCCYILGVRLRGSIVVTSWVSCCVVGCVVTFWVSDCVDRLLLHLGCHAAWLGVLLHSGCQTAWIDCCYILGVTLRGWVCCYILGVRMR